MGAGSPGADREAVEPANGEQRAAGRTEEPISRLYGRSKPANLCGLRLARLQRPAPAEGLTHRSAASEDCRTRHKYARQTTGLKIRGNTFPLVRKV